MSGLLRGLLIAASMITMAAAAETDRAGRILEPGEVVEQVAPEMETPQPPTRVFRSVDGQGRVRFSDQPGDGANEIEVPQPNTVTISPVSPLSSTGDKPAAGESGDDLTVSITSPADGAVLQNPAEPVPVKAAVSPALPAGHRLQLLSNGVVQPGMVLPRPDRGSYALLVQVLDERGESVAESAIVTIQVHRASRLLPATRPAPAKK